MKIQSRVSNMRKFKCFECDIITNFPGLCRDCTQYDGEGNVVKPVKRIRVDESGNDTRSKKPKLPASPIDISVKLTLSATRNTRSN